MADRFTLRALIDRALRSLAERMDRTDARTAALERSVNRLQTAIGRLEARQLGLRERGRGPLAEHEFSVFSQWGEDGIIAWLVRSIDVGPQIFVEFGVEDYTEANTRLLAENDNWTGFVMDASRENIDSVRSSDICWRHNLHAMAAMITRDNINELLVQNGFTGDIGLLSIDIDGNDYWVWKAVRVINPAIVVIEYNHRFGCDEALTIPYEEGFRRGKPYPIYYFGASLKALCLLAAQKGYAFVGCSSNGVNAFFVRRDRMNGNIRELTPAEGYVAGTFTESIDDRGFYVPASPDREKLELMKLPLIRVTDAGETEIR